MSKSGFIPTVLRLVALYVLFKALFGAPGSVVPPLLSGALLMLLPFIGFAAVISSLGRSRRHGGLL